jgi:hypothetical protein
MYSPYNYTSAISTKLRLYATCNIEYNRILIYDLYSLELL